MKKQIFIWFCFTLLFNVYAGAQPVRSEKRGISYNIPYVEDLPVLSKGVSWFYNWGVAPLTEISPVYEQYMDFYPMAWNGIDVAALRTFKAAHPNCKYILAFNEPNLTDQANMTPAQAAAKWPELKAVATELNLKIISPAMNFGTLPNYSDPVKWLDEFFTLVPLSDVDGIAIHCYMSSVSALQWYVGLFKKYGKPIWLTEFCSWEQVPDADAQKDFMVEAVNYLENEPAVQKYAWFIGRNQSGENAFPYMALLTNSDKGVLKELGNIYVNMSSFDKNHYFDTNAKIEAEYFLNSYSIALREIAAGSPNLYLSNFYTNDWAVYPIDVPESKDYIMTLRMACGSGTTLQVIDKDGNILANQVMTSTGGLSTWEYRTINMKLLAGKQLLRLKSAGTGFNIDWFTFGKVEAEVPTVPDDEKIFTFRPTLVTDKLTIVTKENQFSVRLSDLSGKLILLTQNTKEINLSHLPTGVFIVEAKSDKGSKEITRIIKK